MTDQAQTEAIREIPELWEAPGTVLYVGARPGRMNGLQELRLFGHRVTLLEAFEPNCEAFRKMPELVERVVHGDVRDAAKLELGRFDIVFWFHGPEHVHRHELAGVLRALEGMADRVVVLGSPWGEWPQGEAYGNPYEVHVSALEAADYARLGYSVRPFDAEEKLDRRLTAWKVVGPGRNHKVALGVPVVHAHPTWGLMKSLWDLRRPAGPTMLTREWGLPVDEARNELCRWFLEDTDCTWLLQVDHDAVLQRDTLFRLMSWGKPIVSALAFVRMCPVMPAVVKATGYDEAKGVRFDWAAADVRAFIEKHRMWRAGHEPSLLTPPPADSLYPLFDPPGYAGMHCCLIRRDALEAIRRPWFKRMERCVGEDRYFYTMAVSAGVPAYVDLSCVTGHLWGENSLGVMDFLVWDHWETGQAEARKQAEASDGRV